MRALSFDLFDTLVDQSFPQLFQVIVGALFRAKEMDDHIAVIEQHPFDFPTPLPAPREDLKVLFDRHEHAFLKSLQLPVAAAVAKDKIVSKGIQRADV